MLTQPDTVVDAPASAAGESASKCKGPGPLGASEAQATGAATVLQTGMLRSLLTVLACCCWLASSSGAILLNKRIMVDLRFPYPGLVGGIGMCGTALISSVAVRVLRLHDEASAALVTPRFFASSIMPAGLCLALAMHLGNTSYLYLSVAYIQMLKAFTPVVTMLIAFAFGLERPSLPLSVSVTLIAAGVAVASWGEGALNPWGLAAMAGSLLCEGLRLVLMQLLVAQRAMHPLATLALLAPAAALWMGLISGATELRALVGQQPPSPLWQQPGMLVASALAGFCVNSMALAVITLTGALTLKCLGLAKDVGLVAYGALALGEAVSGTQALGYSITLAGFAAYNAIKLGLLGGGGGVVWGPAAALSGCRASECVTAAAAGAAAAAAAGVQQQQHDSGGSSGGDAMVAAAAEQLAGGDAGGTLRNRRPGRTAAVAAAEAVPVTRAS